MTVESFLAPTSFAQRRLWFIDQLDPGSSLYHVPTLLRLTGTLDVDALRRSLDAIVARHEALRTTFTVVDGEPMQIIASDQEMPLPLTDLSGLPPGEREAEEARLSTTEVTRPFDLATGPLIRAHLLRNAPEEHVLVLVVHHIVFDGWSAGVLARELGACYRSFAAGELPRLPELPIQYADYSAWQRQWLTGDALERQLAYWRAQLAGIPTLLELPTDFARPPGRSHQGASESRLLPQPLLEGLKRLGQSEHATLFMTLLAAFQTLLSRYSGQQRFIVGTPIANRTRSELEPLIGFFVNTLALPADLSGHPSFRQLLRRVREASLGAYGHQDLPFERLVEELQPDRAGDRNPLFQVMFAMQHASQARLELPGVSLRRIVRRGATAKFDLSLYAQEEEHGLRARLEYRADLFEAETIRRMLGHLETLVQGALEDPDRPVSALPLLTAGERALVLSEWNKTALAYPGERCVHQLVEEQVRARPSAIAVESGGTRVTYAELDRRANRLAHLLRAEGVGPDVRVGVALERSTDLVVALLAVLKAGGAYVPLDPGYPPERLRFMVSDAGIALMLVGGAPPRALEGEVRMVDLRARRQDLSTLSSAEPEPLACADNLAYVIYTSGSTGTPKGVALTHRGAVAFLTWAERATPPAARRRVLATTSINFDLSVYELFGTLSWGGTVLVTPGPLALPEREATEPATLLNTVPSAAAALVGLGGIPRGLVRVNLAGEPLPASLVEALYAAGVGEVHNLYGPSETTTYSTAAHVARGTPDPPSIGRPIANTQAYVLDRHLEPLPVGIPGELYLGGAGLARGYLGRPGQTADRFVPDPFGLPGARMYRTGDRVRWRPDGTLEFLGRVDHQVKIRGYRVEPGEIESVLGRHAAVRECAVALREDGAGGRMLVAYVAPRAHGEGPPSPELTRALRSYLQERLPEFMVPSAFVLLESLPLSPNGKVDRRALPEPRDRPAASDAHGPAPRTTVEQRLAELWRSLLGVERVGLDDDFFALGGHSLLAVKLFAEIERTFQARLPVSTLFQAARLGQLAAVLGAMSDGGRSAPVAVLRQGDGARPPLFVVHLHYGHVMEYRQMIGRLDPGQPVYGCEIPVGEQDELMLRSLEELAAYHVRNIRGVQPQGPYFVCGYCWAGALAFEIARQLEASGAEVGLLFLVDGPSPGPRRHQSLPQRAHRQSRKVRKLVVDNFRRLRALEPGQVPGFLRQRAVNIVTRIIGATAFRWSGRLKRPLLPAFGDLRGSLLHAALAYRPGTFSGRVVYFRAADVGPSDLAAGWRPLVAGGLEVFDIPGDHDTLMQEPNVEQLTARLLDCMDRTRAAAGRT